MESVEREVTLPVDAGVAWHLITDPAALASWLGAEDDLTVDPGAAGAVVDDDGTRRHLVIETVEPGRRLSWRWWPDSDTDAASRVEVELTPATDATHVRVVERPIVATPQAFASTRSGAWSYRLFALELRCLTASTAVLARS